MRDELGRFLQAVDDAGIPDRVTRRWVTSFPEYQALVAAAREGIDAVSLEAVRAIQWQIADAAQLGVQGANAMTAAAIGSPVSNPMLAMLGQVNVGAITQLVGALQQGSPVRALPGLTQTAIDGMTRELVRGMAGGVNSRVIARRIVETTSMPAHRAATIARTETHRAFRGANLEAYRANRAVREWRWHSELGPRTCSACWSMHGQLFDLDEPMGTHPNCRCTMLPVVDVDLVNRVLGLDVPSESFTTGEEAFAAAPESVQRSVLGPTRYQLYSEGRITLADTVGTRHSEEWGTTRSVANIATTLRNAI